ncbi:MAG: TrmH family RNA methyltransferase [Parachlamydiaceae bacterium]
MERIAREKMKRFSKTKYLSLSKPKQEKLSAERLHSLFLNTSDQEALQEYNLFQEWLSKEQLTTLDPETLSNRYHQHLKEAGIKLKENRFLPFVTSTDKDQALPSLGFHIYLDGLRSAHNVGSILRTVEAFRLGTVYFSEQTPFIDQKNVCDASMGAWEWIDCKKATLKELPQPWICLETSDEAEPLDTASIPSGSTLIVGNEEFGCSQATLHGAHKLIQISLRGKKNSLNVANAFAILAYKLSL